MDIQKAHSSSQDFRKENRVIRELPLADLDKYDGMVIQADPGVAEDKQPRLGLLNSKQNLHRELTSFGQAHGAQILTKAELEDKLVVNEAPGQSQNQSLDSYAQSIAPLEDKPSWAIDLNKNEFLVYLPNGSDPGGVPTPANGATSDSASPAASPTSSSAPTASQATPAPTGGSVPAQPAAKPSPTAANAVPPKPVTQQQALEAVQNKFNVDYNDLKSCSVQPNGNGWTVRASVDYYDPIPKTEHEPNRGWDRWVNKCELWTSYNEISHNEHQITLDQYGNVKEDKCLSSTPERKVDHQWWS